MNGPEHFAEAERLRDLARDAMNSALGEDERWQKAAYFNDAAAVHASLAQTAAMLELGWTTLDGVDQRRWAAVGAVTLGDPNAGHHPHETEPSEELKRAMRERPWNYQPTGAGMVDVAEFLDPHECPLCDATFPNAETLSRHWKSVSHPVTTDAESLITHDVDCAMVQPNGGLVCTCGAYGR